jgi:hypothetical protein
VLQDCVPSMALHSKAVLHSMLAVSAACLCYNMISYGDPELATVNQVLITGYHHYSCASEQMRDIISKSSMGSTLELLVASSVLLVPFTTASQQINNWISSRSEPKGQSKRLSTTPRDLIIIVRGVKTTLLHWNSSTRWMELLGHALPARRFESRAARTVSSRSHVMFPILAATSQRAFSRLQNRLQLSSLMQSNSPMEPVQVDSM